jgi:hypothetical protein
MAAGAMMASIGVLSQSGTATASTVVTLTSAASGVPAPIGIDYYEPTNSIVASVDFPSGSPNNFDQIDSSGNVSQFGSVSGVGDEVYMSAIRTSSCEGGFTPGDIYFGSGLGQIAKLSGGVLTNAWVTLPSETGYVKGGIFQDVYCVAGGDLVVTTDAGDVWRVTSSGVATEIASGFGASYLEGPSTVPNDPARYGPWAGQILASDEANGVIWSIDPTTGTAASWDGGGNFGWAEGVHIVPPNENFFATDYANGAVLGAPASQFASVVGDVVLATELPGRLLDITWDGSAFQSYDLLSSDAGQFEGTTFAPAGLPGVPSTVGGDPTSLTVQAASGDYADATGVSATLVDTTTTNPVSGAQVKFTLDGSETCTATTNTSGVASCSVTPGEVAGPSTLAAAFSGDANYQGASGSANFSVTHEETGLTYTGATSGVNGQPMTLSGVLSTDDPATSTGLAGKSVSFTLGSGGSLQTCSGTTNASGAASCTISSVNQTPGSVGVSDAFAGDTNYSSASASSSATIFAPTALGAFVVGDRSAGAPTNGKTVEFWGSQWSTVNSLSGGSAPTAMKGYANSPTGIACGGHWTTTTGSSSLPPATLPSTIEVIDSSKVTKSGSVLSGNIVHIVLVQVKPGYSNASGHTGTGTIVSTIC